MTTSAIRWRVIRAGAPIGLADVILGEFTAPDKREAVVEHERRINCGEFPATSIVVSALQHEQMQGDAARRKRAKEIRRQERLARSATWHASRRRS